MSSLSVKIEVQDYETCHESCAFLDDDTCLLFNEELDDTVLSESHVWQDDTQPTKQRSHRCKLAT